MKTLFIDTSMGAAGDMLTAALLELFDDRDNMVKKLNSFGIIGVNFSAKDILRSGINGTKSIVKVNGLEEKVEDFHIKEHDHNHSYTHTHESEHVHSNDHNDTHDHTNSHHVHRGMKEITEIINSLNLSKKIKKDVLKVYDLIAEAESISHNIDVSEIHFHEVGSLDAIADIAAVCFLIDRLNVDKIISSPINVGSGHVHCAHGILPVPAPATAYILKDVPIYSARVESELTTPTGAALLKYFVDEYKEMPPMNVKKIGYGMGTKEFEVLNAVRIFLGETESRSDSVYELSLNVDDMTGEEISYAMEKLFEGGAKEVYVIPIIMKKSRPGNLIRVMCTEDNKKEIIKLIFKHTTTIGVREVKTDRYILDRKIENMDSQIGSYRLKKSTGYGALREKIEYDDLKKLADENGKSIYEIYNLLTKGY